MGKEIKRIGVLTSGGDAPGMNAAVRAVVRTAVGQGIECIGIRRGWSGLITSDFVRLDGSSVSRIINRGGTMLYTARSEEFMDAAGREKAIATYKLLGLDVWDYSDEQGNLFGQVCPLYAILWFLLCIPVMPLGRMLRNRLSPPPFVRQIAG